MANVSTMLHNVMGPTQKQYFSPLEHLLNTLARDEVTRNYGSLARDKVTRNYGSLGRDKVTRNYGSLPEQQ